MTTLQLDRPHMLLETGPLVVLGSSFLYPVCVTEC